MTDPNAVCTECGYLPDTPNHWYTCMVALEKQQDEREARLAACRQWIKNHTLPFPNGATWAERQSYLEWCAHNLLSDLKPFIKEI